jgi:hypothetical protein
MFRGDFSSIALQIAQEKIIGVKAQRNCRVGLAQADARYLPSADNFLT